ncbi:helix-turn-helix domain-containing protein [Haloquadratum walsbyi]|jgi:Predicted DNA binding protein|uniref:Putative DNA binding protein n=1 Tax=Haloquadratum walsbyi J07HQW2 TaxID=1238425 RepID=U1PT14_9EURY|nr:helix-turn-helix domain-containing protein [Haloquadratum walsbyi]ERG96927.1 MAG: putative DNA binding protein [Haloquadratum walsbyi J07HQW2]
MSITAKVHIEHERLALVPTLNRLDNIHIRVITQGTTDPGSTTFPFLIEYHDRDELEKALDVDATIDSYELVDETEEAAIYYIEHTPETRLISTVVTKVNGFLIHTETKGGGWLVRLLLPDRSALNAIWEYSTDNDITLDIIEIYSNEDAGGESSFGLTDEQREALQIAFREGYFNEPRDVSLSDVANKLNLSSTAVSGRLRRGMRNLVAATIAEHTQTPSE